nr:hypothetical protein [Tanacetum cinerariifolium]
MCYLDQASCKSGTNKIAQAIEITKLKQRVKRLEKQRQFKSSRLKRLRKGMLEESQAKVYHLDLEHADKVLSMQETDEVEPAKVKEVIEVVTAANLMTKVVTTAATTPITAALVPKANAPRRRRGVIIQDLKEAATASVSVQSEVKSKDKGKGILVEKLKPLKRQAQIEQDEAFAIELEAELNANINWNDVVDQVKRKERKDNTVMRYQALKMKLITEAHARKNMMEEEVSKRKSKSSEHRAAKKKKIDEEVEELKTHLQIVPNDKDDVYTEAIPLALKMLEESAAAVEKMKRLL